VEMTVGGEILNDDATGSAEGDKSSPGCDITKFADIIVRGERLLRDQPLFRHTIRVRAKHHMANVEEPPVKECVFWIGCRIFQKGRVALGRLRSTEAFFVHALALNWEDAYIGVVIPRTVRQFAQSEVRIRQVGLQGLDVGGRN